MISDFVSIIMPSYNSAKLITYSIQSVLKQTYTNWELIIVDDCSIDNSVEIIRGFEQIDSRIRLISLSTNQGAAMARNTALENAKGKYIAFLDSDDIWEPSKLDLQICFMKQNKYGFTYSSYYTMLENGNKTNKVIHCLSQVNYKQYLRNTIIGCLTVIIDKSIVGDFRMPNIKSSQDMATWLLILKRGFTAYGFDEVLAGYRLVENSNSSQKIKAAKDVWKVYRKIERLSLLYSVSCFVGYVFNAVKKRI